MSNTTFASKPVVPATPASADPVNIDSADAAGSAELREPAISTVERIARHLENGIIFGELAPRERIQELKVAGDLGVSRGSVREALLVLEGRHMVSILPRRGALVRPLNTAESVSYTHLTLPTILLV